MRLRVTIMALCPLLLTGCGLSLQNLPLGQDVDGPSYELTAVFSDAAGLPLGGQVKIGQALAGRVATIEVDGFQAKVKMRISEAIRLPKGTRAGLRLTTPLGEEYVALDLPAQPSGELLGNGSTIPLADTTRAPDIENTLASLALVLNGSGLEHLRTVTTELNKALGGREQQVRDLLDRLTGLVTSLGKHTPDINRTIDALAELAKTTSDNRVVLDTALTKLAPAIDVLRDQQQNFTKLLNQVSSLSTAARDVLSKTQRGLVDQLRKVGPILDTLAGFEKNLGPTLDSLGKVRELLLRAAPGDYLNLYLTVLPAISGGRPLLPQLPAGPLGVEQLLQGGTR